MGTRTTAKEAPEVRARKLVRYLLTKGLGGFGPLSSAMMLGDEYLIDQGYASDDARVDALIRRETARNFTTGFVTGVGGIITLPVAIPSALAASWLIQARMAGAIAHIYGHDLESERVRTTILLSLAGDVAKDALKGIGLQFGSRLTQRAVDQLPGRALVEINKRIGLRLLTTAGQRSFASFSKIVPVVGGVVGGAMDAMVCRLVGRTAKSLLRRPDGATVEGELVRSG